MKRRALEYGHQKPLVKRCKGNSLACLPEEILLEIVGHLDQQDTLALLCTASEFARPARKRLYRRILICEKRQDTYFHDQCLRKKFTLLSSWENIIKFFKYLHSHRDSAVHSYIEELSSYNYLDHGNKIDSYRHLGASDLSNILALRQCWEIVVNNCSSLQKFIVPKLPLEKLMLLSREIKSNLVEVSINLDDDPVSGFEVLRESQSLSRDFYLPNLTKLVLNLDHKTESDPIMFQIVHHLVDPNCDWKNNSLEHLEINGNFGKVDREFEHFLRHSAADRDVSLKTSFLKGLEAGKLRYLYEKSIDDLVRHRKKYKRTTVVDLENFEDIDSDEEGIGDQNDEEDLDSNEDGDDVDDDDDDEVNDEEFTPVLNNVEFDEILINNYNLGHNESALGPGIFGNLIQYQFDKLTNLTLSNLNLFDNKLDQIHQFVSQNAETLKTLSFNNCYLLCHGGSSTFQTTELLNGIHLPNLENFIFNITPIDLTIGGEYATAVNELLLHKTNSRINPSEDLKRTIKEFEHLYLLNLESLILRSKKLKNLKIHLTSTTMKLHNFLQIFQSLSSTGSSIPIKNIKYVNKVDVFKIIRKVINVKIFKKFNHFQNLNLIDDYHFGLFKKLIEFFNAVCRVENYNTNPFEVSRTGACGGLFDEEFRYLFKDDVRGFFEAIPSLETFEYFGFTYWRKEM